MRMNVTLTLLYFFFFYKRMSVTSNRDLLQQWFHLNTEYWAAMVALLLVIQFPFKLKLVNVDIVWERVCSLCVTITIFRKNVNKER